MTYAKMVTRPYCYGYDIPYKVIGALCEDGVRRTARLNVNPDTAYSIGGRVSVKGRTVTGFVTGRETDGHRDCEFIAYANGKNGNLLG